LPFPESALPEYSDLSPIQLVKKCAGSNDVELWKEFIRRFQPVIAAAVLRAARPFGDPPRQLLDDLIQDTYLKLCEDDSRMLRSFKPQSENSIYGYLKVVAANIVRDHFKSQLAGKRGAGQIDAIEEPFETDPKMKGTDGETPIYRSVQLKEIDKVLQKVTEGKDQQRKCMIFWLRHRQGLTASEIAALPSIGLSTEGVESVLLRLTVSVRSQLGKARAG
jgi:RNA polymerase sigma-70 factor, ECF subfamily